MSDTEFAAGLQNRILLYNKRSEDLLLSHIRWTHTHLVGLVVGHQFVDGRRLGDLQQHRLRLLPPAGRPRAHVAQVAGARALALAGTFHTHAGRHALGSRVQQTGNVCWVGQRPRLFVALL